MTDCNAYSVNKNLRVIAGQFSRLLNPDRSFQIAGAPAAFRKLRRAFSRTRGPHPFDYWSVNAFSRRRKGELRSSERH